MDLFIHRGWSVYFWTKIGYGIEWKEIQPINDLNLKYYERIPQMSNLVDDSIFLPNKSLSKKLPRIELPNEVQEILVV